MNYEQIKQAAFLNELEKVGFSLRDIEEGVGGNFFFSKKEEPVAQKLLDEQVSKRVGLRHPWLTGIPTLGIWPAISEGSATGEIMDNLLRRNASMRSRVRDALLLQAALDHAEAAESQADASWAALAHNA